MGSNRCVCLISLIACASLIAFASCGSDNDEGSVDAGNEQRSDAGTKQCDKTDPEGRSCEASEDCTVECQCANGKVEAGGCSNKSCNSASSGCELACESLGLGSYEGSFCFVGKGASGGEDGGTSGEKAGYGEACSHHYDCEGWTGSVDTSEVFCITVCDHKFCANTCESSGDCPGFDQCDELLSSCVPDRYVDCI
ncbi:MAG: hypothetical protein ACOX6T_04710 [Myxococcales bacterium]|jgi:hypothetical protein